MAGQVTVPHGYSAYAHETLTVSNAVKTCTAATYDAAVVRGAIVNPADQDIRYTFDGTTPAAGTGLRLAAGDTLVLLGQGNVANLKMIREDASDASVGVTYLR